MVRPNLGANFKSVSTRRETTSLVGGPLPVKVVKAATHQSVRAKPRAAEPCLKAQPRDECGMLSRGAASLLSFWMIEQGNRPGRWSSNSRAQEKRGHSHDALDPA